MSLVEIYYVLSCGGQKIWVDNYNTLLITYNITLEF
jgi:hypothetical protein